MARARTLLILGLLLAGCAAQPGATTTPTTSPSSPITEAPEPTPEPTASAEPTPAFEGHPGAGLALVQFPESDSPVSQIYVVEADGSLRQLADLNGGIGGRLPVWSPDRTQIAFGPPKVGFPGINGQISVINADGTGERVLGVGDFQAWSPDSTRLIIHEKDDVTSDPFEFWITDVASGEITMHMGDGYLAQWIDDETVGFLRNVPTDDGSFANGIYIQALDGSEPVQLPAESETMATWSPDGSQVLLWHDRQDGSIVIAETDGSNPRDLASGYAPVWSPDGTRVLLGYDVSQDGLPVLALIDLEGNEIWSGVVGAAPSWSPDGTRIAIEIAYPVPMVQVIDAATGDLLWEVEASQPNWGT
jgi:Tol biopolymer transport system component